mmetsp:Transcript_9913/g.28148  ORF Transcript_9913/g.28148 Transcript_9913/m.28148 type:complete len:219 (-) Transcript_9913:108-764(-)
MAAMARTVPKLWSDVRQRRKFEDLADFYAILKATEQLERAYISSAITQSEYTQECNKLIGQFKTSEKALQSAGAITSTKDFIYEYQLDVPRAVERLVESGVPATTIYHTTAEAGGGAAIAETTQTIITAMDALKLEQRAVDDIHPLISDVMGSITKVPDLPKDFTGLAKTQEWLVTLNQMRAADEIDEDQARQLIFDLELVYTSFVDWLKKKGGSQGS